LQLQQEEPTATPSRKTFLFCLMLQGTKQKKLDLLQPEMEENS
jgi:hypothetical protein